MLIDIFFEIPASKLNARALRKFVPDNEEYWPVVFAPHMKLEVRPYKRVIYSVRGENNIGILVHILKSDFTGGELVVRQNDKQKSIFKTGEWMAINGDCPHRI